MIDAMLPPSTGGLLAERGDGAVTPLDLGAHNLADSVIVELAVGDARVIVTGNARDFAYVTADHILLRRRCWHPRRWRSRRL